MRHLSRLFVAVLAILLLAGGFVLTDGLLAGDLDRLRDHARMHRFYQDWRDARGGSCCNNTDCAPVQYRTGTETEYEIFVENGWWKVPNDKILKRDSPDGNAHACIPIWPRDANPTNRIKCFVPGSLI